MGLTTAGITMALNHMLNTESVTRPTAWYVALHMDDPGAAGTSNEVTTSEDADYARQSVTFGAESGGQVLNSAAVSWTVNSGSSGYTITHASVWTAATSGTCLWYGPLTASRALIANDVETFAIGEIVAALA